LDKNPGDGIAESETQTATSSLDKRSALSKIESHSSGYTGTRISFELTETTASLERSCRPQVCQTAVITTIGGGPASTTIACPTCDPGATGNIATADPSDKIYTITFVTDLIIDSWSQEVETAAVYGAVPSINNEQLYCLLHRAWC
jgi:hypothetical protein